MTAGDGGLKTRHILYVDDEQTNLTAFKYLFREHYTVHVALSAAEGLALLHAHDIEVVLADQRMPQTSGVAFLAQVVEEFPATVRCVVSGYADIDAMVGAINWAHIHHYFRKPWDELEMRVFIDEALRRLGDASALAEAHEKSRQLNLELEQRVAERTAELEEAAEMFRSITTAAQSAIVMIDGSNKVILWNPAAMTLFGWSEQEAIGRSLVELIVPERYRPNNSGFAEFSGRGSGSLLDSMSELMAQTKDGREIPIEMSLSSMRVGGDWGAVGIMNDITARQRTKRELIAAREAAEEANRAKSAFLANMSHEIRTPMNAILGFCQLLQRDEAIAAPAAEMIDSITGAGERLLRLINEILDMSKIEAGHIELEPTTFDLHRLLDELELVYRPRVEAKAVEFFVEIDTNMPRYVRGDEGRLRQVLVNLLGNAAKFTDDGRITLSARANGPGRVAFAIRDTGLGISQDDLERVFERFAQTAQGSHRGGSGLGLPLSRELARMMGGDIALTSTLGEGSTFDVDIQVQPGDAAELQHVEPTRRVFGIAPDGDAPRILIVDDLVENRQILSRMLTGVGFDVAEVSDGRSAIAQVCEWQPALVLMDLQMPGMDGYEATRQIKAEHPEVRVLVVTASAFDKHRLDAVAAGADGFVGKPYKQEALFEVIRGAIGVRYICADEPRKVADAQEVSDAAFADELAAISDGVIGRLRNAAVTGDLDELNALLDDLPAGSVVAEHLKALANSYQYDVLLEALGGDL